MTVTSARLKSWLFSLRVKVTVVDSPALSMVFSAPMVTVGATVSTVMDKGVAGLFRPNGLVATTCRALMP